MGSRSPLITLDHVVRLRQVFGRSFCFWMACIFVESFATSTFYPDGSLQLVVVIGATLVLALTSGQVWWCLTKLVNEVSPDAG